MVGFLSPIFLGIDTIQSRRIKLTERANKNNSKSYKKIIGNSCPILLPLGASDEACSALSFPNLTTNGLQMAFLFLFQVEMSWCSLFELEKS